jgi:phosphoglycolate phosphatase-like HAD superfamily hydrolase
MTMRRARGPSRSQWIGACQFHDLKDAQVLDEVRKRAGSVSAPLVLLDLDSTLYDVGPRTHAILREWIDSPESKDHRRVREELRFLEQRHVGYSLRDTFAAIGLHVTEREVATAWESVLPFWALRFFTSAYLRHDRPYPGAAEFTRALHGAGCELIYLTGRDKPRMGDGTEANLVRDGFPWDTERTHLLMKPTEAMPDLEHKLAAAQFVRERGTLVASFENEPANLVGLFNQFPEAMHVFVHTVCSEHPAEPARGLYRIRGWA